MDIPKDIEDFILSLKGKGDAHVTIMDVERHPDGFRLPVSLMLIHEGKGSLRRRDYYISYVPAIRELVLVYGFLLDIPAIMRETVEKAFETYAVRHEGNGVRVKAIDEHLSLMAYRRIDAADISDRTIELIVEGCVPLKHEWEGAMEHLYKEFCLPGLGGGTKPH